MKNEIHNCHTMSRSQSLILSPQSESHKNKDGASLVKTDPPKVPRHRDPEIQEDTKVCRAVSGCTTMSFVSLAC